MTNELYKTANARTSFICESLLGYTAQDGKQYDKIALVLVLRGADNKAQQTVRYFLDVPTAKVLAHDLFAGELRDEFKEYKQHNGKQRALSIKQHENVYRVSIMNSNGGEDKHSLYFDITAWQARELAISVLDHIKHYELARLMVLHLNKDGDNGHTQRTRI
ncbi:hypothetical protein DRO69_02780 [Candidatus Bathyarchaeota archaeon]|nr:MAG: hypothetical protein DRO69_02780 [Candidatus Bathyarchaeota archaeon]